MSLPLFAVRDSSQAELENSKDSWSLLTVVLLGAAVTLLLIVFVVGLAAKVGRARARPRAGALASGNNAGSGTGTRPGGTFLVTFRRILYKII